MTGMQSLLPSGEPKQFLTHLDPREPGAYDTSQIPYPNSFHQAPKPMMAFRDDIFLQGPAQDVFDKLDNGDWVFLSPLIPAKKAGNTV